MSGINLQGKPRQVALPAIKSAELVHDSLLVRYLLRMCKLNPMHVFGRLIALGLCILIAVPSGSGQHRITLTEAFRIGDAPGDMFFASIPVVSVDSRNRVFIKDGHVFNVVSSTGDVVGLFGETGEGPGEFQSASSAVFGPMDSVYVLDTRLRRLTVFAPDDFRFVRTLRVPHGEISSPAGLVSVTSQGMAAILYRRVVRSPDPEDAGRAVSVYVVSLGDGKRHTRPLAVLPDIEFVDYRTPSGDSYGINLPFGRRPNVRAGPGGLVYYGMSDSVSIRIVSLDFRDRGIVAWQHSPVPVTRSDRDELRKKVGERAYLLKALASVTYPRYKPAYERFVVDDQARVWLKLSTAFGAQETTWVVLDSTSQELGRIDLPKGLNIRAVRGNRAYGTVAADDGAPLVIAYDAAFR